MDLQAEYAVAVSAIITSDDADIFDDEKLEAMRAELNEPLNDAVHSLRREIQNTAEHFQQLPDDFEPLEAL
jgi:predicted nuclease with TOPRIM domain